MSRTPLESVAAPEWLTGACEYRMIMAIMKLSIPDALKSNVPQTTWGKVLTATPVIMTVVATMLAGLASSEMTRAQYSRSLAAQRQSKAGDQWGYFQAKRLRGALQRNTFDLLQNTAEVHPLDSAALEKAGVDLKSAAVPQTLAALQQGAVPAVPALPQLDPAVKAAIEAVEKSAPDEEMARRIGPISDQTLTAALRAANDSVAAFDAATRPVNEAIDRIEKLLARPDAAAVPLRRDFAAARMRYTAARYDAEARLNQGVANLYELQVRKGNIEAERHHKRSQRFFFGMLAAQAGVIIATFAMAAQKRSLLWSLAAAAGAAAVGFAVYVYLFV